jgi:hypothetical protein
MNINSAFPSKYLKASDAEEDLVLTVKSVKLELIGQGQQAEQKPVLYFDEEAKGMVLNKTNAKMLAKIAKSDDTDEWKGTKVRVIATEVEYQGDLVMSLRIREDKKRPATRQAPAEPAEAPTEDEIPF